MMKKTLCLFFVLALIAQICAIPAGHGAESKDVKDATDRAAGLKDEATKDASDTTNKATKDATDGVGKATGAAADATKKGEHEVAKHGGEDCHKPGTHNGPISKVIKKTEEAGKKLADASVKVVTDAMHILGL